MNNKFTIKERITKAKISLGYDKPFFSYLLMNIDIEESDPADTPTMKIYESGRLCYNPDFVNMLKDKPLSFCLCHEILHIATMSFKRKGVRNHKVWNIATDLVINYILKCEGMIPPSRMGKIEMLIPDNDGNFKIFNKETETEHIINIKDKSAEEVYDQIEKHFPNGIGDMRGFDEHIEEYGNDKEMREVNYEKWRKNIVNARVLNKGRLSGGSDYLSRLINDIIDPKINWKSKLFKYVTNMLPVDYSMRLPSRRFFTTGIYLPTCIMENLEIIIGIDISGSIGMEEYKEFINETLGIVSNHKNVSGHIIGWAGHVDEKDDYEFSCGSNFDVNSIKMTNSGLTSLSSFTEYCESKHYNPRVYVILTNGWVEDNPIIPQRDTIFVIAKNGTDDIVGKYGEVCCLKDI